MTFTVLMASHHLKQHLAIDRRVGMSVSSPVSGIAPLDINSNITHHTLTQPRYMTRQSSLRWPIQALARLGPEDGTSSDWQGHIHLGTSSLAHAFERDGRYRSMRQLVNGDDVGKHILNAMSHTQQALP